MSGRHGRRFPDGPVCIAPFSRLSAGARGVVVVFTVLGAPTTASALDKASCVDSHASAQASMKAGRLQEAKEQLLACANSSCPKLVRQDCEKWLSNLDRHLQPVTIEARDATGKVLMAVRVPVEVQAEAGTKAGTKAGTETGSDPEPPTPPTPAPPPVGIRAAEDGPSPRNDSVRAPAEPRHSWPTTAWVTGVLALASFGTAAVIGVTGFSEARSLRETCAPNCPSSRVSAVRQELVIADVSALTGVAFSAVTAWIVWTHREADRHEAPKPDAARLSAWITGRSFLLDYATSF
jgi:hypothetical protein